MRFFVKDGTVYDMTTRDVATLTPEYVCEALNEKWQREDAPSIRVDLPQGTYTIDELRAAIGAVIPPLHAHVIKNLPVPGGSGNVSMEPDPDGRT